MVIGALVLDHELVCEQIKHLIRKGHFMDFLKYSY
jgi:hypothetical protein